MNRRKLRRRKGSGPPPPARRRVRTPELTPPPPGMPPAPAGNTSRAQPSDIFNLPARYTYPHTALRSEEFFEDDEYTEHDSDCVPDIVTDDGFYTICCVVMWLTLILKTKAAG